jgi:hypothetical protein
MDEWFGPRMKYGQIHLKIFSREGCGVVMKFQSLTEVIVIFESSDYGINVSRE